MTDSAANQNPAGNDHELISINRNPDSDSLVADQENILIFTRFFVHGVKIKEQEYGGGDCEGKFRNIALGEDTLTIDKYDCGDYGFGNSEFIAQGDSLLYVRKYKMEWSPDSNGNEFKVSETIYRFSPNGVTTKVNRRSSKELKDFSTNKEKSEEIRFAGQEKYNQFKKELKDIARKQNLKE